MRWFTGLLGTSRMSKIGDQISSTSMQLLWGVGQLHRYVGGRGARVRSSDDRRFRVEMNGDWFPWSGWYYGGEEWIDDKPDEWEGPERFKVAYRHVVDRVRGRGAKNIQWMFHTK